MLTIRIVWLGMLAAVIAMAQESPADPLAAAEQNAEARIGEWAALSQGMEARLARLLPCAPQVKDTIEEVHLASQARMTAMTQYLQAAIAKGANDTEAAKRLLAGETAMAADWDIEASEAKEERATLEGEIDKLNASLQQKAALADAQKTLAGIADGAKQRAAQTADRAEKAPELSAAIRDLVAAHESRQTALQAELAALTTEAGRWEAYYTARLARAQAECTITNPGAAPRPQRPPQRTRQRPGQGKQNR